MRNGLIMGFLLLAVCGMSLSSVSATHYTYYRALDKNNKCYSDDDLPGYDQDGKGTIFDQLRDKGYGTVEAKQWSEFAYNYFFTTNGKSLKATSFKTDYLFIDDDTYWVTIF